MNAKHNPELAALLSQEAQCAAEFLSLLEEESPLLTSCNPTAILNYSQRKELLAAQLTEIEEQRCRYLTNLGLPLHFPALIQTLAENGANEALAIIQELQRIATACAETNRRNGLLIENRLRYTQRALAIITGHAAAEEPPLTYGQKNRGGIKRNIR